MGRREQIRGRLEAATPGPWTTEPGERALEIDVMAGERYVATCHPYATSSRSVRDADRNADLIAHAPSDLRDLLAVADAAAVVIRAIISQGAGPAAPIFDEFDAAVEAARGGWFKVDGEAIDSLRNALDRLDNGGDR